MKPLPIVAALVSVTLGGASAAQAPSSIFHCAFMSTATTTYYSTSPITADVGAFRQLQHAWTGYLNATYGLGLPADALGPCDDVSKVGTAPEKFIADDEKRVQNRGTKVVHVNWTPPASVTTATPGGGEPPGHRIGSLPTVQPAPTTATPATTTPQPPEPKPATPPPPAAAPAPASTAPSSSAPARGAPASAVRTATVEAYHCIYTVRRGQQLVRYSSGVIQTSAAVTALTEAWRQELITNHSVADAKGSCSVLAGTADQRDKAVARLEESWKNMQNEVVHVDWKTAPGQIKF